MQTFDESDIAAELLARDAAEHSYYEFVKQAWPWAEGGRPLVDNWHIGAIAEHLQATIHGDIRNLLINMPPRMLKSNLSSVMLTPWAWIKYPNLRFLYNSYTEKLSLRDSRKARALISGRWYQARWGDRFRMAEDSNTQIRFDNDRFGFRVASSVDGTNTGEGGDVLVVDDPNSAQELSESTLESVIDWWEGVMTTRVQDFRTTRRIIVQQRVHERDLSGHLLKKERENWVHLCLPMEYEPNRKCHTVRLPSTGEAVWCDPRQEPGEILHKEMISPISLRGLKRGLGSEYAVSGQLQQRPAPGEGGIIKRAWFKPWQNDAPPKIEFILMSVDTALSERATAAFSAVTTWGVFKDNDGNPHVILLSMWRDRCEYPDLRSRLVAMSKNYLDDGTGAPKNSGVAPDIILIESKVSGVSLIQDLRRAGVFATPFNPDKLGDKLARVRLITPLLENGRVWVPMQGPDFKRPRPYADIFVEQCAVFPRGDSRDLVDTMTQALHKLQQTGWVYREKEGFELKGLAAHGLDEREMEPLY